MSHRSRRSAVVDAVPSRDRLYRSNKGDAERSPIGIYLLAFFFGANAGNGIVLSAVELSIIVATFSVGQLGRVVAILGVTVLFFESFRGVLGHRLIGLVGGLTICGLFGLVGSYGVISAGSERGLAVALFVGLVALYLLARRELFVPSGGENAT